MAQYDLEILIKTTANAASKTLSAIINSLKQISSSAGSASKAIASGFAVAGKAISTAADSLDRFDKVSKKFGREFTQNVTVPIAALAGLSLKKVFDEASQGRGTEATMAFARSVQQLKKDFDQLLITIGTQLAPIAERVSNFFRGLIAIYQNLSPGTKQLITNFALMAASIGPLVLGLTAFAGIFGKILSIIGPVISFLPKLIAFFTSPVALIGALVASLVGLTNIFLNLRKAGQTTGQALIDIFGLVVNFYQKYVTGNILTLTEKIVGGIGSLVSIFTNRFDESFIKIQASIKETVNGLDKNFSDSKGKIDKTLAGVGSSAADSFTLGFSTGLDKLGNVFDDVIKRAGPKIKSMNQSIRDYAAATGTSISQDASFAFTELDVEMTAIQDSIAQKAKEIDNAIAGNITNSFLDFAEGAKSAQEAFADFARSTLRYLAELILRQQVLNAISGFAGATGIASASTAGGTGLLGVNTRFAEGGHVTGPGSSTSDSIMARLSNGEFVSDAKTVGTFGVDFFHNLKRMARGGVSTKKQGPIPAFASGGLVGAGGNAPQVVIQNSGSPKEATETSFDPSTAVTTVVLEDLQKNGSISKAMQRNFGVRRSGFR